jgi:hypothetical protein
MSTTDFSEDTERLERCEAEATALFNLATKDALTAYYATVTLIPDAPGSPRYERARDAAKRKYELTSKPAWALRNRALNDLMLTGEVSEATSYAFDELKVSLAHAAALEEA